MKRTTIASITAGLLLAGFALPFAAYALVDNPSNFLPSNPHRWAGRQQEAAQPASLCPVSGRQADQSEYVLHEGRKITFCCASCKQPFQAVPEHYLKGRN